MLKKESSDFEKLKQEYLQKISSLVKEINDSTSEAQTVSIEIAKKKTELELLQAQMTQIERAIDENASRQKALAAQIFSSYCDILDAEYTKQEKEYDDLIALLGMSYNEVMAQREKQYEQQRLQLEASFTERQQQIESQLESEKAELEKIRSTRVAAQEAVLREQKIKEEREFYSIPINESDLRDIKILESIKSTLAKPRVLSMLIWSTWFQKPMTQLCNNILGTKVITGIYKITNQNNNMCYIG